MLSKQDSYLHEMGIPLYDVRDIERFKGYSPDSIQVPETCKLVFVSSIYPVGDDAKLFEKVLSSMSLSLEEALHIYPQYISLVSNQNQNQNQDWVWFSGSPVDARMQGRVLHSPELSSVKGNAKNRRDLWQQICENR